MKNDFANLPQEKQNEMEQLFDEVFTEDTEKPGKLYSFDDTGNAQRFYDMFGGEMIYNHIDKTWLYWDGKRWHADLDKETYRRAAFSIEKMQRELEIYMEQDEENGTKNADAFAKHIKYARSMKGEKALVEMAQQLMPILSSQLDCHAMAFNTNSGIISLKTGEVFPHEQKWLITKLSEVEYGSGKSGSNYPRWLKFLDEIFAGDRELIRYVQKAVGYSMTGKTSEQCVFFLFGTGNNGKSTFLDVIRDIMGEYAMNIQPETIMVRTANSAANSDIARLKGARFVTSVEPNEGMRINEGLLKQLTGEDIVTARKLYANEFEFKPEFKLWMATNHKPIIRGTDTGIWRRIHMIPFTVSIPEEKKDKELKGKLREEYSGILRWAVEGCLLWQKEGLVMPRAVLDMCKEYRREMDVISAFIEDRCEVREGVYEKSSMLFAAYTAWCAANNEYKMSNTKFGIELSKKFERVKRTDGNYYVGLTLYK